MANLPESCWDGYHRSTFFRGCACNRADGCWWGQRVVEKASSANQSTGLPSSHRFRRSLWGRAWMFRSKRQICASSVPVWLAITLFVASRYPHPRSAGDPGGSSERVGGMWVDTYPYVRLHQPHPMFTAGNIRWTLGKPPAYLASSPSARPLQHCLVEIETTACRRILPAGQWNPTSRGPTGFW